MKAFLISAALVFVSLSVIAVPANGNTKPWRYDSKQDHLAGPWLSDEYLCDMVVLVAEFDLEHMNTDALKKMGEALSYTKGRRYRIVGSMRGRRLTAAKFNDFIESCQFSLGKSLPFYNNFAMKENEPQSEAYPFYYVGGMRGEIYYSGADIDEAIKVLQAKSPYHTGDHPIFGAAKPVQLQAITNEFHVGCPARKGVEWLKKMAKSKESEIAAEAEHFLVAINQKRRWNLADLRTLSDTQPAKCEWELQKLLKMWPEMKNERWAVEMRENLKANPHRSALARIVCACEAEAERPEKRIAQARAALKLYQSNRPKLEKLKSCNDSTASYEAMKYSSRLEELIEELKRCMQ